MSAKSGILNLGPGDAHLQNEILSYKCYICNKDAIGDEMVLLRLDEKKMAFACLSHPEIVQKFIKQYGRPPLDWEKIEKEYEKAEEKDSLKKSDN
jgi:hypothetical protein